MTYKNKELASAHQRKYRHATGRNQSMSEAKDSSLYLGVYIAERVLSNHFEHITRMPCNNPGFDYICGRGFKIDVKSACLHHPSHRPPRWSITIKKNNIADYFLILLFDNRDDLNPQHLLLVPGYAINDHTGICISTIPKYYSKWIKYETPLDKVVACCNAMRPEAIT